MQSLLLNSRIRRFSFLSQNLKQSLSTFNHLRTISHSNQSFSNNKLQFFNDQKFQTNNKLSLFSPALIKPHFHKMSSLNSGHRNLIFRPISTTNVTSGLAENNSEQTKKDEKKPSKFKQLYSQYGPLFVVVHLITVIMWIYGFFLISKQSVFFKVNTNSKFNIQNLMFFCKTKSKKEGMISHNC